MKKITFLLILIFILLLSGCKPNEILDNVDGCNQVYPSEYIDFIKNRPVYITSIGQSIDLENLVIRLQHYKITNFEVQYFLDLEEVENDAVIFIVAGASIKGLGDSGTSINDEIARLNKMSKFQEAKRLSFIVFHLGGNSRRGVTSDLIIDETFKIADLAIYLEEGNDDGYFCYLANKYEIDYVGCLGFSELDNAILSLYNLKFNNN